MQTSAAQSIEPEPRPSDAPASAPRSTITKRPTAAALKTERTFALAVAIVPFAGLVAAIALHAIRGTDLAILVVTYAITGFGITAGFHRLFTHKSFDCPPWVRAAFAIAGSMAVQGPVIRWVADHRRHHAFSDREGDPHSPHLQGGHGAVAALRELWHAHMGWFFAEEKTRIKKFVPDLLADKLIVRIDRHYMTWLFLSLAVPFVLGLALSRSIGGALSALLWGGLVRIFFVHHVTWSINSICHFFGKKPYETRDESRDNVWLAIPSLGESWHNAHHAFPTSAVHGLGRFQIDLSARLIRTLEVLGLASNVKRPTAAQMSGKSSEAS